MGKQRIKGDPIKQYDSFFEAFNNIKTKKSNSNLGEQMSPTLQGFNTGIGKSKYDSNFNWNAEADYEDIQGSINEHRAQEQSGLAQVGLGIGRTGIKALTEIAKLPGVVGGIIASPFVEENERFDTAFNNKWIKSIDQFQNKINTDILPVYTAKAVKEGNLWDNISSTSFWATDGADGLGFIIAMMAPGAVFEYAGLGGKLIQSLSKTSKFAGMVEKTEAGVSALKYMGITGKNIDSSLAVMGNTIFEAGAEAKGVGDHLDRKKNEFIQKETLKILSNLDNQRRLGQITIEQYNELSQNASLKAEESFKEQRALAMRDTFVSNVGILLGPNAIMHKAIWGKAGKTFTKAESSILNTLKGIGKRVGIATVSEGFWEEGSQTSIENLNINRAMSKKAGKNNSFYTFGEAAFGQLDRNSDYAKEYINTVSSLDGQKAIFLGAALGGGMMSIQGYRSDNRNKTQTNSILDGIQSQITYFNDTFDNDIYQKDDKGDYIFKKDLEGNNTTERLINNKKVVEVAKALNFTEQQSELFDKAVESGNIEVVENLKQQAIFNMILPAIHNGEMGLQALEQKLNEDSKFNEIIERDKTSDEKDKAKNFIKETLETAKYLQKQNEKFQDFSKDIIELKNHKATPEQKKDFLNKLNSSYLNVKHQLKQNEKSLKILEEKRNNIFEELGIDPLYDSNSEFPISKMKGDILSNDDIIERAKKTKEIIELNPLLSKIDLEYNDLKNKIEKSKKDISDIWQDKLIDKSFDDYIKIDNELEKEVSEEKVQEVDEITNLLNEKLSETDEFGENELTQEEYEALLNNETVPEKTKAAIVEIQKEKVEQLPTKAEKETKRNLNRAEIEGVNEKDIAKDDSIYKEEDEDVANSFINSKEVIEPEIKNNPLGHKIQRDLLIKSNPKLAEKYKKFEKTPRDKREDEVTFSLGDFINNDTVKDIWNNFLKTDKIDKSGIKWLEEYLPIKVTLSNNEEQCSSFLKSKKGSPNFESYELPLRKAIVKALIENKGDFTKFKGSVQGQGKGKLNLDNVSTQNNVLDISTLKELSKLDLLKYLKDNTYIVNYDKQLVHAKTGKISINSFSNVIKSFHSGDVFLVFTRPNGEQVPIKLNNKRIVQEKAKAIVKLLALISNVIKTGQSDNVLSDKDFKDFLNKNIGENAYNQLKSEINFTKRNNNNLRLRQILNYVVFSQNNNDISKLFLDEQGNLTVGRLLQKVNEDLQSENNDFDKNLTAIGFTGFAGQNIDGFLKDELDNNEQARFNHLVRFIMYKKTNIIASEFENDNYVEHVFGINNKESLVSTNVSVDKDMFEGYSDIFLNNEVTTLEDDKNNAKELKEIENTEIPLAKEVVYNEPIFNIESKLGHQENIKLYNEFKNIIRQFQKQFPEYSDIIIKNSDILNVYIVGGTTDVNRNNESRGDLDVVFLHQNEVDNQQINEFGAAIQKLQYFITDMGNNRQQPAIESNLRPSEKSSPINISEIIVNELKNNSENIRNNEKNSVPLSNLDNVKSIKDMKVLIEWARKNGYDFTTETFSIKKMFEDLKQKYYNDNKLKEEVKTICGL